MQNIDYTVSEFLGDEYFHKWLIDPDPACEEFWNKWMAGNPERVKVVEEAKKIILSATFREEKLGSVEKEILWNDINITIENSKNKKTKIWYPIAAAISLLFVSSLFFLSSGDSIEQSNTEVVYIEKSVPLGEKATIRLTDGTLVKLNSGSKIRYPEHFSDNTRDVYLEGEGFFDVSRDVSRPFKVRSGEIETTVLGTSFNISAYPEQENIDVSVVTGKVFVRNASYQLPDEGSDMSIYLTPNNQATYSRSNRALKKSAFVAQEVLSWKDNLIYFKDADFSDIKEVLEKWYGVRFEIQREIVIEKDFSGQFDNKPLSTVLQGLSFSLDFEYVIKESIVTIK